MDEMKSLIKSDKCSTKEASKIIASKYKMKSSDLYNEYIRRN